MTKVFLVMATGALIAFATAFSATSAGAHERCVCTSSIPVPPAPPVAPVPPVPPVPPAAGYRIHKKVIFIGPHGRHQVRIVRIVNREDGRMTRDEFIRRAEHAFDEHDKNHDGVLENGEREDMGDVDEDSDSEVIEIPEPPEPPEAVEPPEPPEAPEPPPPPRHHH